MESRLGVVWLTAIAILASACGDSSKTSVTAPSGARCEVAATAQPASIEAPGGAISVVITTNRECAWEARSEADWLAARSGVTGQGDGAVQYAAAANALVTARQGAIVVNDRRVQISQGAAPCVFGLDRSERSVASTGGRHDVAVSAQAGCAWTAVSDAPWITVVAGGSGQGPGVVSLAVSPNPAAEPRAGAVMIAGQLHRVEQGGLSQTPTPQPGCVFAVAPQSLTFEADGGAADVTITVPLAECAWSAASSDPWITVQPPASGNGSGRLRLTVARHTATTFRSGTVTVAGTAISIIQAAAGQPAPTPCSFTVAPTAIPAPADGSSGEVGVTASATACQWTASSQAPWITIASGGGTGSGRVAYTVAPNTAAAPRSGTLTVAGATVTINQAAAAAPPTPTPPTPCTFSVSPTSAPFPADGAPGSVTVTASASTCAWTAAPGAPWITITGAAGGTGSGQLAFTVAANPATMPRSGTLTVAGTNVTIDQAAAAPPACSYAVTPSPVNVGFGGDNDIDLHVRTGPGCAWTAASQAGWITINGSPNGSGDGHVHIAVAPTLAVSGRTGALVIGGQTVTVNQTGILDQEVTMQGGVSGLSGACPNLTFTINGTAIVTNGATEYQGKDNDCSDLHDGGTARVRGRGQADGSIRATRIDKINENFSALAREEDEE